MVVYLCRKWTPRKLLIAGVLMLAVAPAILTAEGLWSRQWTPKQVQAASEQLWAPTPAMVANEVAAYRGSWAEQMRVRAADSAQMQTVFFVLFTFWRAAGLMLAGMAFFKLGVFRARLRRPDYWAMVFAGACVGIPITLCGTWRDFAGGWEFRNSFFFGLQFNYWASLLVSMGWVGAVMLACQSARLDSGDAATGRGRAHGVHELHSANTDLHDDLLWPRLWPVRQSRTRWATGDRIDDLGSAADSVADLAAILLIRSP